MDLSRLNTGEKLAGASGILLLVFMWLFDWFSIDAGFGFEGGLNAWQSFGFIDIVIFIAAVAGIALAVVAASQTDVDLPVALSAITAGIGILAVVLIVFRIISPPDFEDLVDTNRSIGVFLGLIAAGGVAAGGWMAMQEEGASVTAPPSGGAPPPPPSAPPPPRSAPPPAQ